MWSLVDTEGALVKRAAPGAASSSGPEAVVSLRRPSIKCVIRQSSAREGRQGQWGSGVCYTSSPMTKESLE